MVDDLPKTYCFLCREPLFVVEGIFAVGDGYGLFCDNPKCGRYGLFTALSLPEDPDEEKDKKDNSEGVK